MSPQRFIIPASCLAIGVLLGSWHSLPTTQISANQDPPDTRASSATAQAEAAKKVYEGHLFRMKRLGQPKVDAVNLEFLCQWSRRWQDAERAIHKAKDKQVAASVAHLHRIKELEAICDKLVSQKGDIAPYEVAVVRFHRIEAEKRLAETKGQ